MLLPCKKPFVANTEIRQTGRQEWRPYTDGAFCRDGVPSDPPEVANLILDAIESGTEDVYPDAMSQGVMQVFATNRVATEKQFCTYIP